MKVLNPVVISGERSPDVSPTCAVVIFRVNVSCVTSLDGISTMVIDLIGQLSCDFNGRLSVRRYWV